MDETPKFGWLKKPWMYTRPKNLELIIKWREMWINFIVDYAQQKNIHLINKNDLRQEHPFNKMDQLAFEDVVNALVESGYAKWWDKDKQQLRIYWRSLEQWAEQLFKIAKEKQKNVITGVSGILELEPKLTIMPKKDIEEIIKIMVERGFARWIDRKTQALRLVI